MANADDYAILVAIQVYPGIAHLGGPENDARDLYDWLVDPDGGDLPATNIQTIYSSQYYPDGASAVADSVDIYEASPDETEFKKALNQWLKDPNGDWKKRVGRRLYLFFAGHGFTAGSLTDPALYTAQAQPGDNAHIAVERYMGRLKNAGFFDEIILLLDCCQDVLKATGVTEPTWNPPDRQMNARVQVVELFGAPRGQRAFEAADAGGAVRGYVTSVFMDALRTAEAEPDGFVQARTVEGRFLDLWTACFQQQTGYAPTITTPHRLPLYRRRPPVVPDPPGVMGDRRSDASIPGLDGAPTRGRHWSANVRAARPAGHGSGAPSAGARAPEGVLLEVRASDPGAQIRILDARGWLIREGIGSVKRRFSYGSYRARFLVGTNSSDRPFEVLPDGAVRVDGEAIAGPAGGLRIEQAALSFPSPVPWPDALTPDGQASAGRRLQDRLVQRARGTAGAALLILARDSAHRSGRGWCMPETLRAALRLRRLMGDGAEPVAVSLAPEVVEEHGSCGVLALGLEPGTYLLGTRRVQGAQGYWQELVLTLPADGWRTEVYLDSIDDAFTGRRYDSETASVFIVPRQEPDLLPSRAYRLTEIARQALAEGRVGVDAATLRALISGKLVAPMLALYSAAALTFRPTPPRRDIARLCARLRSLGCVNPADLQVLEWFAGGAEGNGDGLTLGGDALPCLSRSWQIVAQSGRRLRWPRGTQRSVGLWLTPSTLWTQVLIADGGDQGSDDARTGKPLPLGDIPAADLLLRLGRPRATATSLEQVLRRELTNAAEAQNQGTTGSIVRRVSEAAQIDEDILLSLLQRACAESTASPQVDRSLAGA